jgi:pimeloyl-ACP methyl ester carboxylesterase
MRRILLLAAIFLANGAAAAPVPRAVIADPPRDARHPAHNRQLLVPSHGVGMNGLLLSASGKGPHRTVILLHGLPGNERNLDLAQAIRRAGWDVLVFTYRGAWGSPGIFSIAGAMEDTRAALDFARSPEAAKLGIDGRHVVLAGHSMGGATAMMTAATTHGVDGLILIDAANLAEAARLPREELIAGNDDFGNALNGATPESIADEFLARGQQWDSVAAAGKLKGVPVLNITARYGLAASNRPVTAALRRAGARVTAMEMNSDHAFADHRIALSAAVVRWLQALRP